MIYGGPKCKVHLVIWVLQPYGCSVRTYRVFRVSILGVVMTVSVNHLQFWYLGPQGKASQLGDCSNQAVVQYLCLLPCLEPPIIQKYVDPSPTMGRNSGNLVKPSQSHYEPSAKQAPILQSPLNQPIQGAHKETSSISRVYDPQNSQLSGFQVPPLGCSRRLQPDKVSFNSAISACVAPGERLGVELR